MVIHLAWLPAQSFAGLSEWFTESAMSEDGQYILVTISDRPLDVELADDRLNAAEREHTQYLRTTYPARGLYRNDGSTTPLWTYDGRWYDKPIIAPDGEHVIFLGDWTWNEYGEFAVDFTHRGRTIRYYYKYDFIPAFWLKCLLNGGHPECDGVSFDAASMTCSIRTNQHEEFVFDVTTGKLIGIRSPFPAYFAIAGVAFGAVVAISIYRMRPKKRPTSD